MTGKDELAGIVTVLVPLFNHEAVVGDCLDSLLGSTTRRIELLVSDDASSDRSAEVVARWLSCNAGLFAYAALLRQPTNLGITGNLTALLSAARGEYITMLASDDRLTAGAVDRQREALEVDSSIDFVFANVARMTADGAPLENHFDARHERVLRNLRCASVDAIANWSMPWGRVFARRAAFSALGRYPSEHSFEDRWSGLKIVQTGRFAYLPIVVHRYRMRSRGTGTAGLESNRMYRDFWDAERLVLQNSLGLQKWLLTLRVRAANRVPVPEFTRPLWWILSRAVTAAHRLAILCVRSRESRLP